MGGALSAWLSPASQPGPPTAEAADLAPGGRYAELLGTRFFVSRASGLLIYYRTWPHEETETAIIEGSTGGGARAHVYLAHGYGEHCGRYERTARLLAHAGFAVHALDFGGHGQSEGERAYTERLSHYSSDLHQLADEVCPPPRGSGARRFLLAHSMGGLISLLTAAEDGSGEAPRIFSGLVLSAPLIESADKTIDTPFNRLKARIGGASIPKFIGAPGVTPSKVANDRIVCETYQRDPLVWHGGMRARLGNEFVLGMDRVKALGPTTALDIPMLIMHAEGDELVAASGSHWLRSVARNADVTLRLVPDAGHEILNEPVGVALVHEIVLWLSARL